MRRFVVLQTNLSQKPSKVKKKNQYEFITFPASFPGAGQFSVDAVRRENRGRGSRWLGNSPTTPSDPRIINPVTQSAPRATSERRLWTRLLHFNCKTINCLLKRKLHLHFITISTNVRSLLLSHVIATLRAESSSIFPDTSGRGRRLCQRPREFILSMLQNQM